MNPEKGNYSVRDSRFLTDNYLNAARKGVPHASDQLDVMVRIIRAQSSDVSRFLDIGSGDGVLSAVILESFPNSRGILLDSSASAIATAKDKLRGSRNRLEFLVLDYSADKQWHRKVRGAGEFDTIVSGYSIHHQTDGRKRDLYGEILDLLRPGGLFLNLEHVLSESEWVESIWDNMMIDSVYEANRDIYGSREQVAEKVRLGRSKGENILSPVELQCSWLREIGFQDVSCFFKVFEFAVFGGRRPIQ